MRGGAADRVKEGRALERRNHRLRGGTLPRPDPGYGGLANGKGNRAAFYLRDAPARHHADEHDGSNDQPQALTPSALRF